MDWEVLTYILMTKAAFPSDTNMTYDNFLGSCWDRLLLHCISILITTNILQKNPQVLCCSKHSAFLQSPTCKLWRPQCSQKHVSRLSQRVIVFTKLLTGANYWKNMMFVECLLTSMKVLGKKIHKYLWEVRILSAIHLALHLALSPYQILQRNGKYALQCYE